MADDSQTKIEFLRDIFPSLSPAAILARINSAPLAERTTDALVSFFLEEEGKKEQKNTEIMEENKSHNHIETNNIATNTTQTLADSQKSKYQIKDDDTDEENNDLDLNESVVSEDPVEYSATTGKIEKSAAVLQQEEDDFKLAQKLSEEEDLAAARQLQSTYDVQPYQYQSQSQSYQSMHDAPPPSPYHKPSPQSTTTSPPKNTPSTSKPTSSSSTTTTPTTTAQSNKRPAHKVLLEDRKAKSAMRDQLQEVRKLRESQWKSSGGKGEANVQQGYGFNVGHYNQLKEFRDKKHQSWHVSKLQQKRVYTLGDMDEARRQEHFASGIMKASDSTAVKVGKEALELTNKFRKDNKLPPLLWHDALCEIGAQHSKNMAEHKVPFSHEGFDGRIKQYPMPYRTAAENVAMNKGMGLFNVASTAVEGWIESPGHRKNLLSNSEYCGIGCYEGADGSWYLTQLFAG